MSTKQLNNERMKNGEQPSRAWDATKRLCRQLNGQRVRLGIGGGSICITRKQKGIVEEFYNGRDVIKAYNHEHASIVRVKEASAKNAAASQKADFLTNCVNPLIRLLTGLRMW